MLGLGTVGAAVGGLIDWTVVAVIFGGFLALALSVAIGLLFGRLGKTQNEQSALCRLLVGSFLVPVAVGLPFIAWGLWVRSMT